MAREDESNEVHVVLHKDARDFVLWRATGNYRTECNSQMFGVKSKILLPQEHCVRQ